ncbi:hypothetical protein [Rosenbergiella collisarenosi]|uniref:hypothetical protein n=1 Tax=Rosenbergiella collisarenosi TaxID=1544695 RepID=UPI001F4E3F7D|nr:hypothetical protein [Rosenbergiella collisarenosi]
MAKVDWDIHRTQYAELSAETGITVREYAEHYGLNMNTARRELKKSLIRDQNDVIRDQNSDQKRDQKGDHMPKKGKSDHQFDDDAIRVKGRKANKVKALTGDAPHSGSKNTPPQGESDHSTRHDTKAKKIITGEGQEIAHVKKPRGKGKPLEEGHELRNKTGARAKPREIDYIVADRLMDEGIEALATRALRESIAHMNQVQRSIGKAVEVLDEEIKNAETPSSDKDDEDSAFSTHPTLKKAKLLMEAGYLYIAHNSMLSGVITSANKVELERRKVVIAEDKSDNTNLATKIIKQATELRDEFGWDDIKTVEYIETFGIKAPASLMARAVKAIAEIKPEVDDAGIIDEEGLDAEARAYAEAKVKAAKFVEDRRQEVAALTDKLGMGDYNEQGERKAGEIDDDYSHLDIDYEATKELYGDDIPPPITIEGDEE